jgi:hypothetical protein
VRHWIGFQLSLVLCALTGCAALPKSPPTAAIAQQGPIVVLGDTQRTLFAESFFCGRERNEAESAALIAQLAHDERPAFVVHLGDMVAVGDSSNDWAYFDQLMRPLSQQRVAIFPVFGNHDLWGNRRFARRNARQRFPELQHDAYAKRYHGLGLVWLNSNLEELAGRRQAEWFETVLRAFDGPGTRGVLVFMHHPVYTNGKHRHGSEYAISELLPHFLAAKRTLVLLSAHVHGYERFYAAKRHFVVTGGAGGPRVEYAAGDEAPWVPATDRLPPGPRPFNYVVIHDRGARLEFEVKCLKGTVGCPSGVLDRFAISLP